MDKTVRWTIRVSEDTDIALRSYLAQNGLRKGELAKFVERAVQKEVFARTVAQIQERNKDVPAEQIEALIDEALVAVRAEHFKQPA